MASEIETAFREFLLDPAYWRPRLSEMAAVPRELALFPRPDLSRPGTEVLELRLRAHDGERLRALVARSAFERVGEAVQLGPVPGLFPDAIDWDRVEDGSTVLLYELPPARRLEDRVLDVLRVADAACSVAAVDCGRLVFGSGTRAERPDELLLAERIRAKGWLEEFRRS